MCNENPVENTKQCLRKRPIKRIYVIVTFFIQIVLYTLNVIYKNTTYNKYGSDLIIIFTLLLQKKWGRPTSHFLIFKLKSQVKMFTLLG